MSSSFDRAVLLYQQSRFDMAERELRQTLANKPDNPGAHALLALCLAKRKQFDEATEEVGKAIIGAPDWSYPHYCHALVLEERQRYAEAEAAAREAIRLAPEDADNYARLAASLFHQRKWQEAFDACQEGLQSDGEHSGCQNIRAMALTKLGRSGEAISAVDHSLQQDPDNDIAHANKGWVLLNQGRPKEALEHFREALRLDPTSEYAQAGIVEALKARHFIYRWMLGYFLWMARLDRRVQWGLIIGAYFGQRVLAATARQNPEIAPFVYPIMILYLVFVVLTWFAVPAFNTLLRFNRYGWYALSHDQRMAANCFAGCVVGALLGAIWFVVTAPPLRVLGSNMAIFCVGIALPLVYVFQCERGWPRKMMSLYAAGMVLLGIWVFFLSGSMDPERAKTMAMIFLIGFLFTPWVVNYLSTQTVRH